MSYVDDAFYRDLASHFSDWQDDARRIVEPLAMEGFRAFLEGRQPMKWLCLSYDALMTEGGRQASWAVLKHNRVFYAGDETQRIKTLAANAQWFEDHMPWDAKYRKASVQGIVANAIDVIVETGDSGPVTPVGINLPNDQSVRERYGSKSVSLSNVSRAYELSTPDALNVPCTVPPSIA